VPDVGPVNKKRGIIKNQQKTNVKVWSTPNLKEIATNFANLRGSMDHGGAEGSEQKDRRAMGRQKKKKKEKKKKKKKKKKEKLQKSERHAANRKNWEGKGK